MGRDKALIELNGRTLIDRALASLGAVCREVAIAGGGPELARYGRILPDQHPGCGPLGGIVSALRQTNRDWNLFHAVDVPFIPESVWRALAETALHSVGIAVMARVAGRVHPLCAAYHCRALAVLEAELVANRWKVTQAVQAAGPVEYLDFAREDWFLNLNSPDDLAALTSPQAERQ